MGKVYEFEEIAEHKVPRTDDFLTAKEMALKSLSALAEKGMIHGAKVFGSVAKGTPSERSDFDLLIVTLHDQSLISLQNIFADIRMETNVGIEPLVVSEEFAKRGDHSVDLMFMEHLANIPNEGNVAGLDPMTILKPSGDLPPTMVLKQYLIQKLRRFREGVFVDSKSDQYKLLQRALEEPVNLGRRILQILPHIDIPLKMPDDGKKEVIGLFRETFKNSGLINGFNDLLVQDSAYTSLLKNSLQGLVNEDGYEYSLSQLFRAVPQALKWTTEVTHTYTALLEGNRKTIEGAHFRGKEG